MTVDRRDFAAYKIHKGHTHFSFAVLGPFQKIQGGYDD